MYAFNTENAWKTGRDLAYGILTCMGKHTLTGMLTASGQQFMDWSPAYRLFSKARVNILKLFNEVTAGTLQEINQQKHIVAHMDDTILKKTGRHISGTSWRRDPLGPPFHTNFIWGQRFVQISLALPDQDGCCQARSIPVDFHHCPSAVKPGKKARHSEWDNYKEQKKQLKLSRQGSKRLAVLRSRIDQQGASDKQLIVSVDGSYTNAEVLKNLSERITIIGRIRKDTKLYCLPDSQPNTGRKRIYGNRLPTPEQIRQSDEYPWQDVKAWAAGKNHVFNVKIIDNVLWRSAGEKHILKLIAIRPLGYRLTKKSRVLYRQPAYLICTDNNLNIKTLLQAYFWRWEIEVNFRDEKTLLGCGEAQVRTAESCQNVPAFIAAVYAMLHLAAFRSCKNKRQVLLPRPKWYKKEPDKRYSTGDILNNLKAQAWARGAGLSFSSFVKQQIITQSQRNSANPAISAMFYMRN